MGSVARQLNVNALHHNSGLLSFTPSPFSLLSPTLSNISPSLSPFLSSEPSQIFNTITRRPLSLNSFFFFPPLRIVMMVGLSQFSHHLRLICDTQLCQLKPLMALQRYTQGCQSSKPWKIPVCCITRLVKEQGSRCMNFKIR